MKALFVRFSFCLLIVVPTLGAAKRAPQPERPPEESIILFENRKVVITLPEGFGIASSADPRGLMLIRIADRQSRVSAEITFFPDPEGRFGDAWTRQEFMHEVFQEYRDGSVEQAMQFEELDPKVGKGTYCIFTDSKLTGKTALPPNEFLNVTTGVKTWPGVVALFTVFSNGTKTKEYRAMMAMLRESVHEPPVPLR